MTAAAGEITARAQREADCEPFLSAYAGSAEAWQ